MRFSDPQIKEIYQALIKPFGHPDPIGFMCRAKMYSDWDSDFVDIYSGKRGFMPMTDMFVQAILGQPTGDLTDLQINLQTALMVDMMLYSQVNSVPAMNYVFDTQDEAGFYNQASSDALNIEIDKLRPNVKRICDPPIATVSDIAKFVMNNTSDGSFVYKVMTLVK
jgi:hypothetical protein